VIPQSFSIDGSRRGAALVGAALAALIVVLGGCGSSYDAPLPDRGNVHYPIGLAMHPDGRFLYVVNSNFNAKYRPDSGGTVSVVDTRSMSIREESTPYLPSFGGSIELNDDASRAYVTSREDNQLVVFRVSEQTAGSDAGASLYCLDDEGEATSDPSNCSIERIPQNSSGTPFPGDPFDLSVSTLRREVPDDNSMEEITVDVVSISYLGSNRVSTVTFPDRQIANAEVETAALISGSNAIIRRPGTLSYYVAGRSTHVVSRFSPFLNFRDTGSFGEVEALFKQGDITVSNFRSRNGRVSIDARGIDFGPEGDRLFVAARRPDALYIFDLVPSNPETGSGLDHELAASVPLSDSPSDVLVHERTDGRRRVYVPSYGDEVIDVVDSEVERLVDRIELPASPYDMVVDTAPDRCDGSGTPCRAYVSLFGDTGAATGTCGPNSDQCGAVGILDLDPTSSRYHHLVRKLR